MSHPSKLGIQEPAGLLPFNINQTKNLASFEVSIYLKQVLINLLFYR
jgi:hypothetical protein